MDFVDRLREFASRIPKLLDHVQTEEATKNALVLPFINVLGYNVFDPTEVVPEFTADVGIKKGEKVDYAIFLEGRPIILFEAKMRGADLSVSHASQLYRYFSVAGVRFAVLTNGILYRFYTDLDAPNKMDAKPFLEFDMLNMEERLIEELKKFAKSSFNVDNILSGATDLRYTREIRRIIGEQAQNPSHDFASFFARQVYDGKLTPAVREQFAQITQRAFSQFINDQINDRLKGALVQERVPVGEPAPAEPAPSPKDDKKEVVTTPEETEAYQIVRAILRESVEPQRISIRDAQTYCAILLDDNNRKPILRLRFNGPQKYLGFLNEQKQEERVPIQSLDDIFQHAERLKMSVGYYIPKPTE